MKKYLQNPLVLSLFALLLLGCQNEEQTTQAEPTVRPIKFFEVSETSGQKTSQYPATISAANTSELSFLVAGKITGFNLKEAEKVTKGQVIAKLDDSDYRNQYNGIKAQFDNAESEYNRSESLLAQEAIAKSVVEQRKSQMDALKAQLDAAKKALDDTVLKAPYSGIVSNISVKDFQNIQPLQAVATIINEKILDASVNIPASTISQTPNNDLISASIVFESFPDLNIPATYKEIALTADPTTQTYLLKFQFEAPTEALILPGMNGRLTLVAQNNKGDKNGQILVPVNAIQSGPEGQFVWLINMDNMTVSKTAVEVESAIGEMIPVKVGLKVGDTVAAAGGAYLAEGMKVKKWTNQ